MANFTHGQVRNGKEFDECFRCCGNGYIEHYSLFHNGVCYRCNGSGGVWLTEGTLAKRAKSEEQAAARRLKREAEKAAAKAADDAAKWDAWEEAHANTVIAVMTLPRRGDFSLDMRTKIENKEPLTERQEAAVLRIHEKMLNGALAQEEAEDVPEGRYVLTGEIVKIKEHFNDFGASFKMTVKDSRGFKVWGALPSAISGRGDLIGQTVRFTARVTPAKDNAKFGYFSRPTKAELVTG